MTALDCALMLAPRRRLIAAWLPCATRPRSYCQAATAGQRPREVPPTAGEAATAPHSNEAGTTDELVPVVARLVAAGFTQEQAHLVATNLQQAVAASLGTVEEQLIPQSARDNTVRAYTLDFSHLRSEIRLLEKNDFGILKQENERLTAEVAALKQKIRDDLQRLQSGVRAEMDVDDARVRDEQSSMTGRVAKVDSALDAELQSVRDSIESVRWDTINTIAVVAVAASVGILSWFS